MEASKLISMLIAKLKIAYPYYFKELTDEEFLGLIAMYQEHLSEYDEETLSYAINSIIKKNKFIPTIKEIIDECESYSIKHKNVVIEKMKELGYFKNEQEVDKIYQFMAKGIIPSWFLKDLEKYKLEDSSRLINNKPVEMLNGGVN